MTVLYFYLSLKERKYLQIALIFDRTKELNSIPTKISLNENFQNETFFDEDLHVFILDGKNFASSIGNFIELYSSRTKDSREFWLLDINHWTADILVKESPTNQRTNEPRNQGTKEPTDQRNGPTDQPAEDQQLDKVISDLKDLTLDLDDDLYLFSGKATVIIYFDKSNKSHGR